VSTLSDQLAALGIRPGPDVTISAADEIIQICQAVTLDTPTLEDLDDAAELYNVLEQCVAQLGWRLTRHGIKLAEVTTKYKIAMPCIHSQVEIDEALASLRCKACGAGVNPIWWLGSHAGEITKSEDWRHHLEAEKKRLAVEIDGLKQALSKTKQKVRRGKISEAKQALREDGSEYLIPPAAKRKRRGR
jgi:hypothetical protein